MLHTIRISTDELKVGMFVSGLDRPWLETPFLMQGFRLNSAEEIAHLRSYCSFVFVDVSKSDHEDIPRIKSDRTTTASAPIEDISPEHVPGTSTPIAEIFPWRTLKPYSNSTTSDWKNETAQAWRILDSLIDDVGEIFERVRDGGTLNVLRLKKALEPVVDSMSRNPDACMWLARLKQHDQYVYQHSLSASIWAVALGRQLGLPRRDLRSLSIGCMLMDVGKLRVDRELLQAPRRLSEEETRKVREHVSHGVEIVKESLVMNQDVIDIVAHHHERFDGSGYPKGLMGDGIPAFARIAAIVDTYDAITSNRAHQPPISPSDAIKMLYKCRHREFQAELVEAFIQAVGIYPAGSIVELNTGEVGVVVSENRARRLKPRVMLLLDEHKDRLSKPNTIDLSRVASEQQPSPGGIAKSLQPGAYEIDLSRLEV